MNAQRDFFKDVVNHHLHRHHTCNWDDLLVKLTFVRLTFLQSTIQFWLFYMQFSFLVCFYSNSNRLS